jgi:hypothetical protein
MLARFQVVLVPSREVLASDLTLSEAVAYVEAYQEVSEPGEFEAVIALGQPPASAASARRLRRQATTQALRLA